MKTRLIVLLLSMLGLAQSSRGDGGFLDEVCAPAEHTHFSRCGTPFVHPFNFEPPQIHQDAFFIYRYTHDTIDSEMEHESEAHLDWSLSKRLGMVIGVPLVGIEDATGTQSVGFGDLEFAPRVMWINRDRFIMASNFLITVPTGNESRGLGSGETVLSPFLTTWCDLGNWNTLLMNFGPEVGVDSGDVSLSYACSLTHSWRGPVLLESVHGDEHDLDSDEAPVHFPPGLTTLYLE